MQICSRCNSIKDPNGQWLPMDRYFSLYADLECSHGYCENCVETLLTETASEI
ncbi:MAG: hypothetical protein LBJ64_06900 [Deltaproteobacteria bacterium]|nr:hypothetical protein [Deltaproteobacteria bacterium]